METLILIIEIACISLVVADFEPFQNFKRWISKNYIKRCKPTIYNLSFDILNKITGCSKCLSFWSSLIIYSIYGYNLLEVISLSCITTIVTQIIYKLKNTY